MASGKRSFPRILGWTLGVLLLLTLFFVAWVVVPIATGSPQGSSGQELVVEGYPTTVSARGDDGRTRQLSVQTPSGDPVDMGSIRAGDRIVVSGKGYNPASGIYVAVCKVPERIGQRPGPCLGGVPSTELDGDVSPDVVEYAPSNWINDDWAWRLFGARSFDDRTLGTFTAYIEITSPSDTEVDCTVVSCGLYTRNDHTALADRVQDLYLPVFFTK
jgi:hypothetical protein